MKKTILVVDDDASVRESVDKVLKGAGYEAVLASSGLEAILRFQTHTIDLVLLDIGLPNQKGWDICRHVAGDHPNVPIIVVTGQAGRFKSAVAAGAVALMEKPLDAQRLLRLIQELIGEPPQTDPCHAIRKYYHYENKYSVAQQTTGATRLS